MSSPLNRFELYTPTVMRAIIDRASVIALHFQEHPYISTSELVDEMLNLRKKGICPLIILSVKNGVEIYALKHFSYTKTKMY